MLVAADPPAAPRPALVALEGIDGSGKTTLASSLIAALTARGIRALACQEPSSGPIGVLFRALSNEGGSDAMTLALLSAADRRDLHSWLNGAHAEIVISDRYYLSGLAYHAADDVDPLYYQQLNHGVTRPDLYLFLDIDSRTAAERHPGCRADRWEHGRIAARVPGAYRAALDLVMTRERAQVVRLDAAAPAAAVHHQALAAVLRLLKLPGWADDE
jgi:dTMP kinase